MRLRLSDEAAAQIEAIRLYIAQHSPRSADRVAADIFAACESLTDLPNRGRRGRRRGTREIVVRPYVITYVVSDDLVEIADVSHHAQHR